MWCSFFVYLFFLSRSKSGAPCVRGVHTSNKHCIADYWPISTRFSAFFSEGFALSATLCSSHFCWQVAPQIPRNGGQKLRKFKKSAEKFVRTTSYRQLRDLKKIHCSSLWPQNVDVHIHNFFSARRYIALTVSVKFCIGSLKMARNEQVCAHQ